MSSLFNSHHADTSSRTNTTCFQPCYNTTADSSSYSDVALIWSSLSAYPMEDRDMACADTILDTQCVLSSEATHHRFPAATSAILHCTNQNSTSPAGNGGSSAVFSYKPAKRSSHYDDDEEGTSCDLLKRRKLGDSSGHIQIGDKSEQNSGCCCKKADAATIIPCCELNGWRTYNVGSSSTSNSTKELSSLIELATTQAPSGKLTETSQTNEPLSTSYVVEDHHQRDCPTASDSTTITTATTTTNVTVQPSVSSEELEREARHQHRVSLYIREIKQIQEMRRKQRTEPRLYYPIPVILPARIYTCEDCAICQESLRDNTGKPLAQALTTVLQCGHIIHVECLKQWFARRESEGRCPVCRDVAVSR